MRRKDFIGAGGFFSHAFAAFTAPLVRAFRARYSGRDGRLLARSGLFDEQWYLSHYPDVARARVGAISHYLLYGAREGRDPSPVFQTAYYLSRNPDVAQAGVNPLVHYLLFGESEGRDPNPFFDTDWYRHQYPDVVEKRQNALAHYLETGWASGCNPNPLFDSGWYRRTYLDASGSGVNPLTHYITIGASEGYRTSAIFRTNFKLWERQSGAGATSDVHHRPATVQSRDVLLCTIEQCDRGRGLLFFGRLKQIAERCGDGALQDIGRALDVAQEDAPTDPAAPMVSIVMPVFNRAGLVGQAIQSVLSQSYGNFELLICDDGSTDATWDVCRSFNDARVKLIRQPNSGAAAARNRCLKDAEGDYIAYLDSDNLWHPEFLRVMIRALMMAPGQPLAYANYFDVTVAGDTVDLNRITARAFDYELQLRSPFVDLNSIVHHRALFDTFGGFDEQLKALQDYDLIAKYAWARDAQHVPLALNIYQRFPAIDQISSARWAHADARAIIDEKVSGYYSDGVPSAVPDWLRTVTVLSWDMSRNHFAKAYSVAEALSRSLDVQLISFRFFGERMFAPIAEKKHSFELVSLDGGAFPQFLDRFCDALEMIRGDVIYAVKPRLTSFGLGLLSNQRTGTPVFLEANDLETMLHDSRVGKFHRTVGPDAVLAQAGEAATPYSLIWSQYLDGLAAEMPILFSHNDNLNRHYDSRCLFMRNIKDESIFDPGQMNRAELRRSMGVGDDERIILFGGLVSHHKGVGELLRFVEQHDHYRLFVVGSVETPELEQLKATASNNIRIFPAQAPADMARLNHLADVVILWLDPREAVGHYQMPYKFTDAIAMGTPVVASPVSDLATLTNIVWHVPYGDFDALSSTLERLFSNHAERLRRCEAGRRLFQKEFTYRAVPQNLALAGHLTAPQVRYDAAKAFAALFMAFCQKAGADTRRLEALLRPR